MKSCKLRFHLYGCKLTRSTVDALWRTATQDAGDGARCSASSEDGIVNHTAATPEKLLSELGSPDRLGNLTLSVHDDGLPAGRTVYILIETRRVWVSVESSDETWVRGRAAEFKDILRGARVRLGADPHAARAFAFMVLALSSLGATKANAAVRPMAVHHWILLASLLVAVISVAFFAWRWWLRRNTTVITLASAARSWSRRDRIDVGVLAVGLLAAAAAAVEAWAAIRNR